MVGRLTGVVLAGGASSRLGTPKPLVMLGGQLVLARIATVLKRVCDEIVLVVRQDQDDAVPDTGLALGMHVVTDRFSDAGPLAGLDAGLGAVPSGLAFAVGADHPFLSSALVKAMSSEAEAGGWDAVVPVQEDRMQPMHAIYDPAVWTPVFSGALEAGRLSLHRLISEAVQQGRPHVRLFGEDEMAVHDPEGRSLFDIDTPERLVRARQMLGQIGVVRPDIRHGGL
jgi:molybdopterin-guanine dinucleotide biosynthesis protein A